MELPVLDVHSVSKVNVKLIFGGGGDFVVVRQVEGSPASSVDLGFEVDSSVLAGGLESRKPFVDLTSPLWEGQVLVKEKVFLLSQLFCVLFEGNGIQVEEIDLSDPFCTDSHLRGIFSRNGFLVSGRVDVIADEAFLIVAFPCVSEYDMPRRVGLFAWRRSHYWGKVLHAALEAFKV